MNNIALILILFFIPSFAQAKDPQLNYMMECQGCHGADGSGGLETIPAMNNQLAKFLAIPGGREFLVKVPGVAQSSLSDAETTAVLNWMLNRFGPSEIAQSYPPYTVEEVSRLRKTPLTEVQQKRTMLLKMLNRSS